MADVKQPGNTDSLEKNPRISTSPLGKLSQTCENKMNPISELAWDWILWEQAGKGAVCQLVTIFGHCLQVLKTNNVSVKEAGDVGWTGLVGLGGCAWSPRSAKSGISWHRWGPEGHQALEQPLLKGRSGRGWNEPSRAPTLKETNWIWVSLGVADPKEGTFLQHQFSHPALNRPSHLGPHLAPGAVSPFGSHTWNSPALPRSAHRNPLF